MRETVSRGRVAGRQAAGLSAEAVAAAGAGVAARRRRGALVAAGVVVVLVAGVVAGWRARLLLDAPSPARGGLGSTVTRPVVREDIAATTPVAGTLGYAGSYTVTGQGAGTGVEALTWLPSAGRVVRQGQVLYETGNGSPVVLLYGRVPAWRALGEGVAGADVSQLNRDLVALGYVGRAEVAAAGWGYFSAVTAYGVQRLEEHLGVVAPQGLLALGQVVFEPAALRVARVTGSLGGAASGPVLAATSDEHVVSVALDTSQESEIKVGDSVSITLPDGATTPGVVSSVGTVATTSTSGNGTTTTIPVQVRLVDPAVAGAWDQAPVTVYITTATAHEVLVVPVTALLANPGGYDVEVTGPGDTRRYVPVTVGPIFDDNSGLVQVAGDLRPGQRVVVGSS